MNETFQLLDFLPEFYTQGKNRDKVGMIPVEKKSVLIVGNFLSAARHTRNNCEDLAAKLAGRGWHVEFTSTETRRVSRLMDMVSAAWSRRAKFQVACVDVFSGSAFIWAEAVCITLRLARKPYVLYLQGGNLPAFARRWPWRVRRLLLSASAVITPSIFLRDAMVAYYPNIRLLPLPVDLGKFHYCERTAARPKLIWLRAFHDIYNPTIVPKVLALLAPDYPDLQAAMVGPDKHDGTLELTKRVAEDHGVADRLLFPGGIEKAQVPAWLDEYDIFLNTTHFESFGLAVMEAAAAGLCIVSTDVGELPILWQDNQNALLVPYDDPLLMARAVRRILSEPGLSARLSSNGRQNAEQYSWLSVLPAWEDLLSNITSSNSYQ